MAVQLSFESTLRAAPAEVWAEVATMTGVNRELLPFIRMTAPPGVDRLTEETAQQHDGFRSWVLLFSVLPIDRHSFGFDEIREGEGFRERSHSWQNRSWVHAREVTAGPEPGTTTVADELTFEPRMRPMTPVVRAFIGALFRHRHRRLRRRFGAA